MGAYDSPTFLARKDTLLMGLTLQQFGIVFGGGFVWLMMALALDQPLMTSLLLFGPAHVITTVILIVRPAGMLIPVYFALAVKSFITAPVFHVEAEALRSGLPEWFKEEFAAQARELAETAGLSTADIRESGGVSSRFVGALLFFRRKAAQQATSRSAEEARQIAKLEAEQRAGEVVQGAERSLRVMLRMLFKGHM